VVENVVFERAIQLPGDEVRVVQVALSPGPAGHRCELFSRPLGELSQSSRSGGLSQFSRSGGLSQFSRSENGTVPFRNPRAAHRRLLAWGVVAVFAAACLPQTMMRIHYSREGHRMAAEWLERSAPAHGAVVDTHGLTGLYGGRTTVPYERAPAVLGDPRLAYVVLEDRELDYPSRRSLTLRWLLAAAGHKVAEFPPPAARRPNQRRVLVYRWDADRFGRQSGTAVFSLREDSDSSQLRKGTVPFSLRENRDSPRLGKEAKDHVAIDTRVRR